MANPALLFVTSRILDPTVTPDPQFNKMYNEEHLPDVLTYTPQITTLALRYKNSNPSSPHPYLALYPLQDTSFFTTGTLEKLTADTRHSRTFNGQDILQLVHFDPRPYEKIQSFEAHGHAHDTGKDRGQTLVCVAMEPAEGEEAEADFDAWYRKQHLDMLSMCKDYRRTTRYKRLDGVQPRFLALHEWACGPGKIPGEQIAQVTETEWSRKILGEARVFERDVFELVQAQGDLERKL